MAISVNWITKVVIIPQADLTPLSAGRYELDVNSFRLALKDIEDSEEGIAFPDIHKHTTELVLSGVTYSRFVEIINGYTIELQDTGTPYVVTCVGANHNIADVKVLNNVSLIVGNSAGLITVATSGNILTAPQIASAVWQQGIEAGFTAEQLLRILISVSAGSATGLAGVSPAFKSIDGTVTRVAGTYTDGIRTIDTLVGT